MKMIWESLVNRPGRKCNTASSCRYSSNWLLINSHSDEHLLEMLKATFLPWLSDWGWLWLNQRFCTWSTVKTHSSLCTTTPMHGDRHIFLFPGSTPFMCFEHLHCMYSYCCWSTFSLHMYVGNGSLSWREGTLRLVNDSSANSSSMQSSGQLASSVCMAL